jgi:hypothetical protein
VLVRQEVGEADHIHLFFSYSRAAQHILKNM